MHTLREIEPTLHLHQSRFVCTKILQADHVAQLWQRVDEGLMPNFWQAPNSFLMIHAQKWSFNTDLPATLKLNLQGIQCNIEGKVRGEPQHLGMTWHGDFSHQKEGLIAFKLSLSLLPPSLDHQKKKKQSTTRKKQQDTPQSHEMTVSFEIVSFKGRMALLDPRQTAPYWQDSLSIVCEHIETQLQLEIQKQIEERIRREKEQEQQHPKITWKKWLVFLIFFLLLALFFLA